MINKNKTWWNDSTLHATDYQKICKLTYSGCRDNRIVIKYWLKLRNSKHIDQKNKLLIWISQPYVVAESSAFLGHLDFCHSLPLIWLQMSNKTRELFPHFQGEVIILYGY